MSAVLDSDSGAPEWQVSDLSGDIVATIHDGDQGLSTTGEATEYGGLSDSEAIGKQRYGWLGAEQRAADAPSGIVLMGVRLYNPVTGRFLQTDPVYGGSCNAYEYTCADPVDKSDLDGKRTCLGFRKWCFSIGKRKSKWSWCGDCFIMHAGKKFKKWTDRQIRRGKKYGKACVYGAVGLASTRGARGRYGHRPRYKMNWKRWGWQGCYRSVVSKWLWSR
jgi:RHS repeat-associated protein